MTQIEEDTRSLTIVVMHTLFSGLMTLLALAGNLLVFLALYRNRRLRSITNLYVLSLAVADVTVATFFFLFKQSPLAYVSGHLVTILPSL